MDFHFKVLRGYPGFKEGYLGEQIPQSDRTGHHASLGISAPTLAVFPECHLSNQGFCSILSEGADIERHVGSLEALCTSGSQMWV